MDTIRISPEDNVVVALRDIKKGDTVKVVCSINDAADVLGIQESIKYDEAAVAFVSETLDVNAGGFDFDVNKENKGEIRWSQMFDAKGTEFVSQNDIVTFNFKVLKDISKNDGVLSYTIEEVFYKNINDIDKSKSKVSVSVGSGDEKFTENIMYGDVNRDGEIDVVDSLMILRASVDIEKLDKLQSKIADIDSDGEISSSDALVVLRYSVGLIDDKTLVGKKETVDYT